jgi:hypothetical protein
MLTIFAVSDATIVHTLVSNDLRRLMPAEPRLRGVASMDLMGPVLDRLATHLGLTPRQLLSIQEQARGPAW